MMRPEWIRLLRLTVLGLPLALLLLVGCYDGGPFAPEKTPQNPCHPGRWYEVEQTLVYCPEKNR